MQKYKPGDGVRAKINSMEPIKYKNITVKDLEKFLNNKEAMSIAGKLIMDNYKPLYI